MGERALEDACPHLQVIRWGPKETGAWVVRGVSTPVLRHSTAVLPGKTDLHLSSLHQNVTVKPARKDEAYMQQGLRYVGQVYLTHCVDPRGKANAPSLLDELVTTSCTARPRAWAVALDIATRYTASHQPRL